MSETVRIDVDTEEAQEALAAFRDDVNRLVNEDIAPLVDEVGSLFSNLATSIGEELGRAARDGRLSVQSLVRGVLADVTGSAARSLIGAPIEEALTSTFGGARAGGGGVAPGSAVLVGERGPEVFRPFAAGVIAPAQQPPRITINMLSGQGDGPSNGTASAAQLAANVRRVMQRAMRNA